jgi:hypothetical protein
MKECRNKIVNGRSTTLHMLPGILFLSLPVVKHVATNWLLAWLLSNALHNIRQKKAANYLSFSIISSVTSPLPPRRPVFAHGSGQVGFVVDKMSLGQVFSEYFGFPCQFSFHQLLHNHPHLSSGAVQ